ncbi:MAG: MBL fold metallo-hydrolase [Gallionellaceae bacterium]|nr:MBL fold metallo-hydrolase [Gallionellaceae bacterium]MDD5366604.1 MBL fold metallo-hydrolase [Gallionellaceae bacterium]
MKQLLFIFTLLLGQFACAAGPGYPPVSVKVEAVRLAPHSWYVPGLAGAASAANEGFMSNAGFVVTPAGVVVIDSLGTPSLAEAMLKQIRRVTQAPIRYVLVTHYHADHYYGLQVFKDAGAEIWAHEGARGVIGSDAARQRFEQRKEVLAPWVADGLQRFHEPDLWLSGDVDFMLGGVHFLIRHVGPAHSPEDLVVYVKEDGVLYAGDLVFKGRVPFVGDADSKAWLAALDRLIALQPNTLVPGHGSASDTPMADLALTRDYLNFLRAEMARAVADLTSFEEAYGQTDWSRYERMPAFREANRSNAYNTYLLMEKESLAQ